LKEGFDEEKRFDLKGEDDIYAFFVWELINK
jgi:hypothetical protein